MLLVFYINRVKLVARKSKTIIKSGQTSTCGWHWFPGGKVICTALADALQAWSHGGALCLGDRQHSSSCIQPVCVASRSDDDGALRKEAGAKRTQRLWLRAHVRNRHWLACGRRRRDDWLMATATLPEKAAHKWSRPRETNA